MLNYVNFNGKRFDVNYGAKSLTISGQNIENIKSIENLDKLDYLVELNLQNNNIVEIEGLDQLKNLQEPKSKSQSTSFVIKSKTFAISSS